MSRISIWRRIFEVIPEGGVNKMNLAVFFREWSDRSKKWNLKSPMNACSNFFEIGSRGFKKSTRQFAYPWFSLIFLWFRIWNVTGKCMKINEKSRIGNLASRFLETPSTDFHFFLEQTFIGLFRFQFLEPSYHSRKKCARFILSTPRNDLKYPSSLSIQGNQKPYWLRNFTK